MLRLQNRIAVVTGASKGIGKAIAESLAREGADVAICARNASELKKAEREILRHGNRVLSIKADVRRPADVARLAKTVENKLGMPTILINNAGIGKFREILKMADEDFQITLETNLYGVFYVTKAFLPGMIQKKQGHIINIASLAGKNSFAGGAAYCSSKHALISFSECLMLEVRQHNIRVTALCPGTVQTSFGDMNSHNKLWALTSEDVAKAVIDVLTSSPGSLISLVDLRPLHPPQKR
jgi:short-subunit dehydrogenase